MPVNIISLEWQVGSLLFHSGPAFGLPVGIRLATLRKRSWTTWAMGQIQQGTSYALMYYNGTCNWISWNFRAAFSKCGPVPNPLWTREIWHCLSASQFLATVRFPNWCAILLNPITMPACPRMHWAWSKLSWFALSYPCCNVPSCSHSAGFHLDVSHMLHKTKSPVIISKSYEYAAMASS